MTILPLLTLMGVLMSSAPQAADVAATAAPKALDLGATYCQSSPAPFPASRRVSEAQRTGFPELYASPKRCADLYHLDATQIAFEGVSHAWLCLGQQSETDKVEAPVEKQWQALASKANLMLRQMMLGRHFAVLIVQEGASSRLIATAEELATLNPALNTANAALAWAYLQGSLGTSPAGSYYPAALCRGATVKPTSEGWLLENARIFRNCLPAETRSLAISKAGEVKTLLRQELQGEPVLCAD